MEPISLPPSDDFSRRRVIDWHDAAATWSLTVGMSGLEIMRGIRDGTVPPPPMARLIGFDCIGAEPSEVVMELNPDSSLDNGMGLLHGGTAAAMLDTAMGAAANTMLPPDKAVLTLDLKLTYLRPLRLSSGPIRATGKGRFQVRSATPDSMN